tara:strand:+ start:476 stop:640 length:165 start_codon:yes stop_codon:yes gene_type:complete
VVVAVVDKVLHQQEDLEAEGLELLVELVQLLELQIQAVAVVDQETALQEMVVQV